LALALASAFGVVAPVGRHGNFPRRKRWSIVLTIRNCARGIYRHGAMSDIVAERSKADIEYAPWQAAVAISSLGV
jgi:hypothetical protein